MIGELVRVAKPDGCIVLAVPNHDSLPYRTGYRIRKRNGRWRYPDEYTLDPATREIEGIPGVVIQRELTLDRATIYHWLPRGLSLLFRAAGLLVRWPGYLRGIVLRKMP